MKTTKLLLFYLIFCFSDIYAQTTPGGVGDLSGNSILKLWITSQSSNVNASEAQIDTLYDLSGASNHLVVDRATTRPLLKFDRLNGYPSINFSSTNYYLHDVVKDNSFSNDEATLIAVVSRKSQGTIVSVASEGINDEFLLLSGNAYHHSSSHVFTSLSHDCITSDELSPFCILTGVFGKSPTDLNFFYNQVASTQSIQKSGSPVDYNQVNRVVTIGNRQQLLQVECFNGELVELIGYNKKLTETERTLVFDYLSKKYILPSSCGILPTANKIIEATPTLSIYPNPYDALFTINLPNQFRFNISICDMLGHKVFEQKNIYEQIIVDSNNFPKGIYLIKATSNEISLTSKIIKK